MKSKLVNFSKNFLLILTTIVITIFLIEFLYSLYKVSSFRHNKWSNDGRSVFDEYVKLKKNNENLTVTTPPFFLLNKNELTNKVFPLSGISNKLTINCNESGYFSTYLSDRYGFNNIDKLWDKEIDLLLIGDSFTHGACVNYENTFAGNFNSQLNTLSLGYGGNAPLMELATIIEYINLINPKKVIWFFSEGNDLEGLVNEYKHQVFKNYLLKEDFTQNLAEKQTEVDQIQERIVIDELEKFERKKNTLINFQDLSFKNILYLHNIKNLIRYRLKLDFSEKEYINENSFNLFEQVIKKSNKIVKNKNSEFYFVFLPFYPGIFDKDSSRYENYQKVIGIVKNLNIKVIDLQKLMFDNSSDPKSFFPGRIHGHYTENGYKIATNIILKNISNKK